MLKTSTSSLDKNTIVDKYGAKVLKQVEELLSSMSEETKQLLDKKLEKIVRQPCADSEEQSIADLISGKTYSAEEKRELELVNLMNSFALRAKLLEDTITSPEVTKLLGCRSRQTPLDRVKNQTLIAVKDNGKWKYPLWQFDPEGADGVIEGLPKLIKSLEVSNLAKISWLTCPHPVYGNQVVM